MSAQFKRSERVAQDIQSVISSLFIEGFRNPDIGLVTLTSVRLTDDLKFAKVYVVAHQTDAEKTLQALQRVSPYIRRELAARLKLRYTPEIRFYYDESLDYGNKIQKLLLQTKIED